MGNAVVAPAHLSQEQFVASRERFRLRLVEQLGVPNDKVRLVRNDTFFLCEVPPEDGVDRLLVSFGSSWVYGNEIVYRFSSSSNDETTLLEEISTVQGMFVQMQKEAEFRYYESAQVVGLHFRNENQLGEVGCLILPEAQLRGLEWNPENQFTTVGPLCDDDLFPRHFLHVVPLTPAEYRLCAGLSGLRFSQLMMRRMNPMRVDVFRSCLTKNIEFMSDIQTLRLQEPTRSFADGLSIDIRVRKNGRHIDIVTTGRCVAHYALPLEEAFDKPVVPVGSEVGVQSDGGQCIVQFYAHLPDDEQTPVASMEEAVVIVKPLRFAKHPNLNAELILAPKEAREMSLLTPKDLWEKHKIIRMLHLSVHAPHHWLKSIANDARKHFENSPNQDFEEEPLVFPFEIANQNPLCGFEERLMQPQDKDIPFRLRFLVASIDYFEDRAYLDDNGNYHKEN